MSRTAQGVQLRAVGTAVMLFVFGAVTGILADRLLLRPVRLEAAPLTMDAMVDRLGLSEVESLRVRALLDSLHTELAGVLLDDPESLRGRVGQIQQRIESALPEDARSEFREWMEEHHQSMIGRGRHGPSHATP
jgi:hypothetical protein